MKNFNFKNMTKEFKFGWGGINPSESNTSFRSLEVVYNNETIQKIIDPNIKTRNNMPCAVPSPFARLDLVKNAFKNIVQTQYLKRDDKFAFLLDEKLVSNTLDLAQAVFNKDSLCDENGNKLELEFCQWTYPKWRDNSFAIKSDNDDSNLKNLYNSSNDSHKNLAEVLLLYLNQDNESYHFNKASGFTIIKCNNTVLGSTSPITMFVPTANDNKIKNLGITVKNKVGNSLQIDKLFDNDYKHLYERDEAFQQFMYSFIDTLGKLNLMVDFKNYLEKSKKLANSRVYNSTNTQFLQPIENLIILDNLIELQFRQLPNYFEDKLIIFNYTLNNNNYHNLFIEIVYSDENLSILIPLKLDYFKNLNIDIFEFNKNKNNYFRHQQINNNILTITLLFPFEITKEYNLDNDIINKDFANTFISFFPNFKIKEPAHQFYYLNSISKKNMDINFYKIINNNFVSVNVSDKKHLRNENDFYSKYYKLEGDEFDFLEVEIDKVKALLIPKFETDGISNKIYTGNGNGYITYSIDFGTTQTYIHSEYKKDSSVTVWEKKKIEIENILNTSFPLNIVNKHHFLDIYKNFLTEMLPMHTFKSYEDCFLDNKGSNIMSFPIKTVISLGKNNLNLRNESMYSTNIENEFSFGKINIPFLFDNFCEENNILTNIKWSDELDKAIVGFLDPIFLLLKIHALKNNVNFNNIKLVWLNTSSMEANKVSILASNFNKFFIKYFNVNTNIESVLESISPYLYFRNVSSSIVSPILCLDIGGGTTDLLMMSAEHKAALVSSFKFAGNNFFGKEKSNSWLNGIVQKVKDELDKDPSRFRKTIHNLGNKIKNLHNGFDLINYLFSIEKNNTQESQNYYLSTILKRDKRFRVGLIYAFTAKLFYTFKMLEKSNIEFPKSIIFSGNATKIIELLVDQTDYDSIKTIFEKLINIIAGSLGNQDNYIKFYAELNTPKEVTAMGALNYGGIKDLFSTKITEEPPKDIPINAPQNVGTNNNNGSFNNEDVLKSSSTENNPVNNSQNFDQLKNLINSVQKNLHTSNIDNSNDLTVNQFMNTHKQALIENIQDFINVLDKVFYNLFNVNNNLFFLDKKSAVDLFKIINENKQENTIISIFYNIINNKRVGENKIKDEAIFFYYIEFIYEEFKKKLNN